MMDLTGWTRNASAQQSTYARPNRQRCAPDVDKCRVAPRAASVVQRSASDGRIRADFDIVRNLHDAD